MNKINRFERHKNYGAFKQFVVYYLQNEHIRQHSVNNIVQIINTLNHCEYDKMKQT